MNKAGEVALLKHYYSSQKYSLSMHHKHGMKTSENYFSTKYTRMWLVLPGDLVAISQQLLTWDLVKSLHQGNQGKSVPRPGGTSYSLILLRWNLLTQPLASYSLCVLEGRALFPGALTYSVSHDVLSQHWLESQDFLNWLLYKVFFSDILTKTLLSFGNGFCPMPGPRRSPAQVSVVQPCSAVRSRKRWVGYPLCLYYHQYA